MKSIVENIVSTYENGFESLDSILNTNCQILEDFQTSFLDIKEEREKVKTQLRDNLAKNDSLRKKDFDQMTQGILSILAETETEIKNLVSRHFTEQKEIINLLKSNLMKIKEAIASGETVKAEETQAEINQMLIRQDKKKEEVSAKLKDFQKGQQEMTGKFLELLNKGGKLKAKDLKSMLKEFAAQHRQRMVCHAERKKEAQERKEDVQRMLSEFKQKRIRIIKNCQGEPVLKK